MEKKMRRQEPLSLASASSDAATNVVTYCKELRSNPELQSRVSYVRSWYALRDDAGNWIFGPSKFIGYRDNSTRKYLDLVEKGGVDGRETERVLAKWFQAADPASRLGQELASALRAFLAPYGAPNSRARVNVAIDDIRLKTSADARNPHDLAMRIVSDADICGGRPCIRGTRMRVSDLLEMLAGGATREEILADFPYIKDEDISAALVFGAHSANHRVIRAA